MTTRVKADFFHVNTDAEAELIANAMAVTPEYFADISCEGDRLFGVVTNCQRETCQDTCETVLNGCARKGIWQYSYMVQQELEALLRWTLSPRYVTETLLWDGKSRIKLTFGGIDDLFVQESVTTVDSGLTYYPFVYQATAQAVLGQTYVEVLIPFEYLSKPEGVMFRNPNTLKTFAYTEVRGYPEIRDVLGVTYWVIAIPGGDAQDGDTLDILDCLWGYIETPDVECDDEVAIVYAGTVQKIPIEKVTDERWYIKHRNMVRYEYQDDEVDLTQFQIHKLYNTVDVGCFGETCTLAIISKKCTPETCACSDEDDLPCTVLEAPACATLISGKSGIIEIHEVVALVDDEGGPILDVNGCPTFRQIEDCDDIVDGVPFQVTISYHTNPAYSDLAKTSAVESLRRAIAARVAAEVTLVDCGCNIECGWFKQMRHVINTTSFNPQTGATTVIRRYGDMEGQQIYARTLEAVSRNQSVPIF